MQNLHRDAHQWLLQQHSKPANKLSAPAKLPGLPPLLLPAAAVGIAEGTAIDMRTGSGRPSTFSCHCWAALMDKGRGSGTGGAAPMETASEGGAWRARPAAHASGRPPGGPGAQRPCCASARRACQPRSQIARLQASQVALTCAVRSEAHEPVWHTCVSYTQVPAVRIESRGHCMYPCTHRRS